MASEPLPNRTPGAALLEGYLRDHEITLEAFGEELKVTGVTVHRWVKGKAKPTPDAARQIEVKTGIKAAEFFPDLADMFPRAAA